MYGNRGRDKEMKKFILYAAVFGKKANFKMPKLADPNIERVLYTDMPQRFEPHVFYQVKTLRIDHLDPVRRNRFVKICIPDEVFDNYEHSLYMDYKHPTNIDFDLLLSRLESGSDMLISKHKKRDCIYDEAEKCIELGKGNEHEIKRQVKSYKKDGYPVHNGLFAAYWIFRRHTTRLKELMNLWWLEVRAHSERDQISLPYAARKHGMKISVTRGSR